MIAVAIAVTAAGKENDENDDYPQAAIAVTIIEAHIYLPFSAQMISAAVFCAVWYIGTIVSFEFEAGANSV